MARVSQDAPVQRIFIEDGEVLGNVYTPDMGRFSRRLDLPARFVRQGTACAHIDSWIHIPESCYGLLGPSSPYDGLTSCRIDLYFAVVMHCAETGRSALAHVSTAVTDDGYEDMIRYCANERTKAKARRSLQERRLTLTS